MVLSTSREGSFCMKALIINDLVENKKKDQLRNSIYRKQNILEEWTEKVEELRMELELIKHEYHVRVGGLLLKDNQLDLEILQLKNLKERMAEGMTYGEAVKEEEDAFYNEILRMQKEQEEINEEKEILEKREQVDNSIVEEVKIIWKKLIRKFHPDLVKDPQEKMKREDIMKKINQAYTHFDLETLQSFENNSEIENIEESNIEKLERILVDMENGIDELKMEWVEMKESMWYSWKIKKQKAIRQEDVFADLEKTLLDDVVKKIKILQELRREVIPDYPL